LAVPKRTNYSDDRTCEIADSRINRLTKGRPQLLANMTISAIRLVDWSIKI